MATSFVVIRTKHGFLGKHHKLYMAVGGSVKNSLFSHVYFRLCFIRLTWRGTDVRSHWSVSNSYPNCVCTVYSAVFVSRTCNLADCVVFTFSLLLTRLLIFLRAYDDIGQYLWSLTAKPLEYSETILRLSFVVVMLFCPIRS